MEFVTELYKQLKQELDQIAINRSDGIQLAKHAYQATETAMRRLKEMIAQYSFQNTAEEILFFKELKPKFYSNLIYYVRLFEIHSQAPMASLRSQKKYFNKQLTGIKRFTRDNIGLYRYLRSGATHLDELYFTRKKCDIAVGFDLNYCDCDETFCSSHDFTIANLLANERLIEHLQSEQNRLEHDERCKSFASEEIGLSWSDTKAAFIELLYGLQTMGVFYNTKTSTKADISQVARFFESALNIDLGNYYRTFQEIRIRKKGRTAFIDKLREQLIQRMDESDENPR